MRATTGRWTPPPAGQPHALPSQPAGLPGMAAHRARRAAGLTPNASESSGAGLAPYQYLSAPVYSLATAGPDGQSPTLNLLTYASPVSLEPRTYALGLYHGTLSRENFLATGRGALQILGEQHAALFELLGKQSGRDLDKLAALEARGFTLRTLDGGLRVLDDCYGVMALRMLGPPVARGDHDVVLCAVGWHSAVGAGVRPLTTGFLRDKGLMPALPP